MLAQALELCKTIASKSPVATLGVKTLLNYSRDHTVRDSLNFALTWNQSALQASRMALGRGATLPARVANSSMLSAALPPSLRSDDAYAAAADARLHCIYLLSFVAPAPAHADRRYGRRRNGKNVQVQDPGGVRGLAEAGQAVKVA